MVQSKNRVLTASDGQTRLQLVPPRINFLENERELYSSLVDLTKELVATPSQGGIDKQKDVIDCLSEWFESFGVPYEVIRSRRRKEENSYLGLVASVGTHKPPFYLITACLDTAPFGESRRWSFNPLSARVDHNGWMTGRGSADSKAGISIFAHLMADMRSFPLDGTLVFLADSDEHQGGFGAIKEVVNMHTAKNFAGAFIGYPGCDSIKSGARGFYRSRVSFFGTAEHSGSRTSGCDNAIEKATRFCEYIFANKSSIEIEGENFPLPPKVTVTSIKGGLNSYSVTPSSCNVRVDIRLTPDFQKIHARAFLDRAIKSVTSSFSGQKPKVAVEQSWPAYQIPEGSKLISSLANAAEKQFGYRPLARVCGPSNVGNYLASVGVDAVCGFGVECEGIHGLDERINTASFLPVYKSYKDALLSFLA